MHPELGLMWRGTPSPQAPAASLPVRLSVVLSAWSPARSCTPWPPAQIPSFSSPSLHVPGLSHLFPAICSARILVSLSGVSRVDPPAMSFLDLTAHSHGPVFLVGAPSMPSRFSVTAEKQGGQLPQLSSLLSIPKPNALPLEASTPSSDPTDPCLHHWRLLARAAATPPHPQRLHTHAGDLKGSCCQSNHLPARHSAFPRGPGWA